MVSVVIPLVMAFCIGMGLTLCFFPSDKPLLSHWPLKTSLGIGIGLGMTACTLFCSLIVVPRPRNLFMALEAAMLACVAVALVFGRREGSWRLWKDLKAERPVFLVIALLASSVLTSLVLIFI